MFRQFQAARFTRRRIGHLQRFAFSAIAALFILTPPARAQYPEGVIGSVKGDEISVENSSGVLAPNDPYSILLVSGSIVTVHSGQAVLGLADGKGIINICGPAKFTVLSASGAITIALNFGRLHVELPSSTPITIFSATTIAVPLAINDQPRDATVGLEVSGIFCARATAGAVRIEDQLSGQEMIVPQPGELFLSGGKFNAVKGAPGSCTCNAPVARVAPSIAEPAPLMTPPATLSPSPETAKNSSPAGEKSAPPARSSVEYSIPAPASDVHPVVSARNGAAPDPPAVEEPIWKVIMPPLAYSSSDPAKPAGAREPLPDPQTILLVREVRIASDWEFHGHVEPRLGTLATAKNAPQQSKPKKKGFWALLRRMFGGS
ncbi:MAG: hypothetical protein ACRD50_12755 [Candidatus Acidiferrales bacterium]